MGWLSFLFVPWEVMKAIKMVTEIVKRRAHNYTCFCLLFSNATQKTTSKLKIGHFRDSQKRKDYRGIWKIALFFGFFYSHRLVRAKKGQFLTWQSNAHFVFCHNRIFFQFCGFFDMLRKFTIAQIWMLTSVRRWSKDKGWQCSWNFQH